MNATRFIIRDDARQIRGNVMMGIFMSVLVALPLLFTWFNVLASWDPFGNSDRLKIAVANTDEGYQTDVLNLKVNVGDQVLSQLRGNKSLDWIITDEDTALEGTRSGDYYAAIVLPDNFSTSMFTFYAGGAAPADITLYTNEKKNALSSNISNQGAQGVTSQINAAFTQVLSEVAMGLAEDVSSFLDDEETAATLDRLEVRLESLSTQLTSASHTVSSFQSLVSASVPLVESAQNLTVSLDDSLNTDSGLTGSSDGSDSGLDDATSALGDSLDRTADSVSAVQSRLDSVLNSASTGANSQADALDSAAAGIDNQVAAFRQTRDSLNNAIPSQLRGTPAAVGFLADLDAAIARQESLAQRLHTLASDLRSDQTTNQQARDQARQAIDEATTAIANARDNYRTNLQPQLEQLRSNMADAKDNLAVVGSYLDNIRASFADTDQGLLQTLTDAQTSLGISADNMANGAQRLDDAVKEMADARESGDLKRIAAVIGTDPEGLAKLIASPINVERNEIFPVASFGVGMTPLYSAIALWVGALLSSAFLHTVVSRNVYLRYLAANPPAPAEDDSDGTGVTDGTDGDDNVAQGAGVTGEDAADESGVTEKTKARDGFTGIQEYFGRFFLFWVVGMAQSTLLMLGLIVFVEIQPAHPWLLMISGWITSSVFMLIIYTLVLSLSNAGKAVAVVFLVLQISAAGGAYPLEVLPHWFQNISPWLPATYSINMMRAAIAGIYEWDYLTNMGMLLLFLLPTLLVGLVLRHAIAARIHSMTEDLESTKVM